MTPATRTLHETVYRAFTAVLKAYREWINEQPVKQEQKEPVSRADDPAQ